MALKAPPKEKIKLFQDVDIHNGYVGVIRPQQTDDDSDIEIPETAERTETMEDATARVARVGPEVDHVEAGDKVLVSLYMQQPHQIVAEADDEGNEYHMFIIDADMIVGTVHDQEEAVDEMFN